MNGPDVFNEFLRLSPEEQQNFLGMLGLHLDLHLPDGTHVLLPRQEFARLVEIAKRGVA
jgi:hypothetical protein